MTRLCDKHGPRAVAKRHAVGVLGVLAFVILLGCVASGEAATSAEVYSQALDYLADPAREGRGPGSEGAEEARQYIEQLFEAMGLRGAFGGGYRQKFMMSFGAESTELRLAVSDGERTTLARPGRAFAAFGFSGSAAFEGEAVLAGYGIESAEHDYNSFGDGAAIKGRVAIVLRYEPQDEQGRSRWVGGAAAQRGAWSNEASLLSKTRAAAERGAKALIIVNPPSHDDEKLDASTNLVYGGRSSIPVLHATVEWLEGVLRRSESHGEVKVAALQKQADDGADEPQVIEDVTLSGRVKIEAKQVEAYNIAGMLRGAGELAAEVVVIGAHYDHVGWGAFGSRTREKKIHPGADDNASGAAGLLALAQRFTERAEAGELAGNRRTLLFVAFDGEERGLLGSRHLVEHLGDAALTTERIAFMINLDMIGRLTDEKLSIGGTASGEGLDALVDRYVVGTGFELRKMPSGAGPSDHRSFYRQRIPVLFFFTGFHKDYHTPTDTAEKINVGGAVRVIELVDRFATHLSTEPQRVAYAPPTEGEAG